MELLGRVLQKFLEASIKRNQNPLNLSDPSLLYFKAHACIGCGQIEMFIGSMANSNGRKLIIIDADSGDLPEDIYGGQLILDKDGGIRKAYGVRAFPTLICTGAGGVVESFVVGASSREKIAKRLNLA